MDGFIGEIRMFAGNYAPQNWALCDGSQLPISGNEALFSLIGTTYGGNGVSTFALPDLRGRIPICQGQGNGLTPRPLGQAVGTEGVALSQAEMPNHTHTLNAGAQASAPAPQGNLPGTTSFNLYAPAVTTPATFAGNAISNAGNGAPHNNVMPSLCINFIIMLVGTYPTWN
ncbi:MAG TPA: tail fiber protein [Azospira sp.]|nr:tail fiber protein [Azospira sp.]